MSSVNQIFYLASSGHFLVIYPKCDLSSSHIRGQTCCCRWRWLTFKPGGPFELTDDKASREVA